MSVRLFLMANLLPRPFFEVKMVNIAPRQVFVPSPQLMVAFTGLEGDVQWLSQEMSKQVASKLGRGLGFMNENRKQELELMQKFGWKVELESLNWLGMDFIGEWVGGLLTANEEEYYNKDTLDDDFVDLRLAI